LGEDGAMGGATAAAHGASAAMKEAQGDAALVGHLMQRAVRLPYLPSAGDHAAVLVGVGVAKHDLLLMVPGGEQRFVRGGGPELAADGGSVAQVFDGFEERDGLQAGVPSSFAGGVETGVPASFAGGVETGVGAVGTTFRAATAFDTDSGEARE